jgi:hypothetical protein
VYRTLDSVSAASATDAWAVGFCFAAKPNGQESITLHWDGKTWRLVRSINPPERANLVDLDAVSTVGPKDAWAVGVHADHNVVSPFAERWNGRHWTNHEAPPFRSGAYVEALGVSALTAEDVWVVGEKDAVHGFSERALIEHWNGDRWTRLEP